MDIIDRKIVGYYNNTSPSSVELQWSPRSRAPSLTNYMSLS